jgi:hypothetical protein
LNFRSVSRIARTHDEFIELCEAEVANPSVARIQRGLKLAAANTWEQNVAKMDHHIAQVLAAVAAEADASSRESRSLTSLAYV